MEVIKAGHIRKCDLLLLDENYCLAFRPSLDSKFKVYKYPSEVLVIFFNAVIKLLDMSLI